MAFGDSPVLRSYISDNSAGVSPDIIIAMARVNGGHTAPYGRDSYTAEAEAALATLFDHPLDMFPVATGTAANGLALSVLTPPWGAVLCHPDGHITNDEAGAPEFYTNGAKILLVDGPNSKIDPDALRHAVRDRVGNIHCVQPAVLSLTQPTETGSVYTVEEVRELCAIAHEAGLRVHMDGARFANAVAALNVAPAELTWKAGVDVLAFGATKNGAATVDAVLSFDPTLKKDLAYRHKRGGHLFSKMRYQAAQLTAYITDDLWLNNARQANAMAARIRDALSDTAGISIIGDPQANIVFCQVPTPVIAAMHHDGFTFYDDHWAPGVIRLVTSFTHTPADIDAFTTAMKSHLTTYIHNEL
ncbi:threonine aldolase family protein [Stomatohabitans albus]|uniref:threonine aldolase family protein n=1 Tax=Stomatohabitans albus TaxID=3110766 RepID=UPI00300D9CB1